MHGGDLLEAIARIGYGARGAVYLIVGGLAVLGGLGSGGGATGSKGALQTLLQQPFGHILLGIIAVGLIAFAVWRGVQALADPDHLGSKPKALVIRVAHGISGAIYIGLAVFSFHLLVG